jgi:hypothetical protein
MRVKQTASRRTTFNELGVWRKIAPSISHVSEDTAGGTGGGAAEAAYGRHAELCVPYHPAPQIAPYPEHDDAGLLAQFGKSAWMDGASFGFVPARHISPISS